MYLDTKDDLDIPTWSITHYTTLSGSSIKSSIIYEVKSSRLS